MGDLLKKIGVFFFDITETIVTSLAIFLMIYLLVARPHQVKGSSMFPNFHDGDYILTDMLSYRLNLPERGDVVVFQAPPSPNDEFIKRIIGLPGDRIEIKGDKVYLNGQLEPDVFLPPDFKTKTGQFLTNNKQVLVPEGNYFVMGDNRSASSDSREWGFVPRKNIIGKAFWRYWPPSKFGSITQIHF